MAQEFVWDDGSFIYNEINNQRHCPACQGDLGAIDWYKGMQSFLKHAKTKESRKVKLHREFAQVLSFGGWVE